jgi:hypothetical protein
LAAQREPLESQANMEKPHKALMKHKTPQDEKEQVPVASLESAVKEKEH